MMGIWRLFPVVLAFYGLSLRTIGVELVGCPVPFWFERFQLSVAVSARCRSRRFEHWEDANPETAALSRFFHHFVAFGLLHNRAAQSFQRHSFGSGNGLEAASSSVIILFVGDSMPRQDRGRIRLGYFSRSPMASPASLAHKTQRVERRSPALFVGYVIYSRWRRISVSHVRGPPEGTFLYGNLPEMMMCEAAEMDFKWQEEFGGVVRIRAPFREDRLLISDPKALQYIHQSAGYRFCKAPGRISLSGLLLGPGIIAVDGEVHKRQRRIMQPGFGTSESKALVPIFFDHAKKMTSKWKDILADSKDQQAVFDLPGWISRAALDIIGEAAFDYHFGALDNSENELQKMYTNFVFDAFAVPTHSDILTWSIMDWLPGPILRGLLRSAPSPRLERRRNIRQMSTMVAKKLVTEKYNALAHGKPSKDIMSLLVKANASENPKKRLEDPEMWAQMNSIILAGQETTMSSMCWAFLELARHPEVQRRLRNEIRATEDRACTRDLTAADFESMPYLGAVIKEILRFHPVVYNSFRSSQYEEVLPLHKPIVTQDGRTITELPIPKGIQIISSVAAYHRNTEIFGADAHTFNPTRWLDQTVKTPVSVGVYANLFTFVGGARSCIGWKFALLQMQTFVVELIGTFDLSLTSPSQTIRREACFVMTPTVEGEQEKGTQLNLLVKLAEDR